MKLDKKWAVSLGLAMALPSTIFFTAWGLMKLHEEGVISKLVAILLFLAIVTNTLVMMVVHAYKNKNRS